MLRYAKTFSQFFFGTKSFSILDKGKPLNLPFSYLTTAYIEVHADRTQWRSHIRSGVGGAWPKGSSQNVLHVLPPPPLMLPTCCTVSGVARSLIGGI